MVISHDHSNGAPIARGTISFEIQVAILDVTLLHFAFFPVAVSFGGGGLFLFLKKKLPQIAHTNNAFLPLSYNIQTGGLLLGSVSLYFFAPSPRGS